MTTRVPLTEDDDENPLLVRSDVAGVGGAPSGLQAGPTDTVFAARRADGTTFPAHAAASPLRDATGQLAAAQGVAVDIPARAGTELARAQERLLALHEAAVRLAAQTDPMVALETVLHSAGMLLGASSATFYRWDAAAGLLRCAHNWQVPASDTTPDQRPGEGLAGQAFLLGTPLLVNDYPGWAHAMASGRVAGLRAALAVPLTRAGRALGVIVMRAYAEAIRFTPDDARLLTLFADQAAAALENARLHDASRRELAERVRAERALRVSEARYRQMFEGNRAIQLVLDPDSGAIVDANPAACAFYGHAREALTALTIHDLNTREPDALAAEMADARGERCGYFLFRHRCASGAIRDVEVHSSPISWHGHQFLFSIIHDITERRALEARLRHQATHDSLTGRPNRAHLLAHLGQALIQAERTGRPCAVLFLDLDRFKHVNDSLGHAAGDALLVAVAARLADALRAGDTLARLGGDEFVALLTNLADDREAPRSAARLHAALERPFTVVGHDIVATTSVGLVVATGVADPPEDLLRFADVALYRAKAAGRSRTATYAPAMGSGAMGHLALEHDLRGALAREELVLYYQPKVDLVTGRIAAFEALVRWQHPTRGLVPPGDFIPLAEETGLIVPLGRWTLRAACQQAVTWATGHPDIPAPRVAVNLSAREFHDPALVARVAATLGATTLPPERLILEVTESAALEQVEEAIATMRALRALGVRLALDDFGTGHASLAYLQRLPLDTLKLDRSFFTDTPQNRAIVGAVATLAHGLALEVIAEGLETAVQVTWARAAGCDYGQGYFFARPLPTAAITALWDAGLRFDLPAATPTHRFAPPTATQPAAVSAITRR